MPNLINVLKVSEVETQKPKLTDAERRKEVEKVLKGNGGIDRVGMEWGTCMIFSCENDCCAENGSSVKSCWREEVVLTQWDN